uniref:General transcription factor IIH subunit 4 n=1 Tax=Globodera rostochiensis TaxID=31243 RepID=A0A914H4A1_GLORO
MSDNEFAKRPLLTYLASLNDELVQQLFESRPCVIAIFRLLPAFAQQSVLQLMFHKSSDWRSWTRKRFHLAMSNSLQLLFRLRILEGDFDGDFQINVDFRMNYVSKKSRKAAAGKDLMGKSVERWESILCYLALPNEAADKSVSETTKALFKYIGLVRGSSKEPEISSIGFQYLLLGRTEQIWAYLIHYVRFVASKGEDIFPVLDFLLRLTLCISPDDAKTRPLTLEQKWPEIVQAFVVTLRELGLIFIRKRKDGWFLLTPLMAQLSAVASVEEDKAGENGGAVLRNSPATNSPATAGGKGTGGDGFLIVETNYRVFAYTNSTLQLAILSTFTQILYRFQDIAIGVLSRDSIRRALQTGITARQITQYLTANMRQLHARNSSRASDPVVPVTVVEQIYLWEQERKRFTSDNGTLYSNYDSEADFVAMRDFAREAGLSLWDCSVSKMVIVKADGDERVKRWWTEFRERGGQ